MNVLVANHLNIISELKRLAGHNVYQYKAYKKAANSVLQWYDELHEDYNFLAIDGVGPAIDKEIKDFYVYGNNTPAFQKYFAEISSEYFERDERVECIIEKFVELISEKGFKISVAGSVRRKAPFIRDVDLLTTAPAKVIYEVLDKSAEFEYVYGADLKVRFKHIYSEIEFDIKMTKEEFWIPCLLHSTGSAGLNINMRGIAKRLGYTLNEYGIFKIGEGSPVRTFCSEAEMFDFLNLRYIDPEYR